MTDYYFNKIKLSLDIEPPAIRHLKAYNYLYSMKVGMFTWKGFSAEDIVFGLKTTLDDISISSATKTICGRKVNFPKPIKFNPENVYHDVPELIDNYIEDWLKKLILDEINTPKRQEFHKFIGFSKGVVYCRTYDHAEYLAGAFIRPIVFCPVSTEDRVLTINTPITLCTDVDVTIKNPADFYIIGNNYALGSYRIDKLTFENTGDILNLKMTEKSTATFLDNSNLTDIVLANMAKEFENEKELIDSAVRYFKYDSDYSFLNYLYCDRKKKRKAKQSFILSESDIEFLNNL